MTRRQIRLRKLRRLLAEHYERLICEQPAKAKGVGIRPARQQLIELNLELQEIVTEMKRVVDAT